MQLRKAARTKAKLKLGLTAPSGGGKTLGALLIAYGMMRKKYPSLPDAEIWEKIAIIDTENGSGELYVNKNVDGLVIGEYYAIPITPPFSPKKYVEGIKTCHENNIEVCILDSTTHAWAGQGGLLEQQGNVAKRTGNSYTAWRDVTPLHNQFVDAMLQTDIHIIATMRSKTEYVIEKDGSGKTSVRKMGLAPVQRDGMEYEFTAFFDIDTEHQAFGSKDRTGLFDQQYFKITPETGSVLMDWLESGVEIKKESTPVPKKTEEEHVDSENEEPDEENLETEDTGMTVEELHEEIKTVLGELSSETKKNQVTPKFKELLGIANFLKSDDVEKLKESLEFVKSLQNT